MSGFLCHLRRFSVSIHVKIQIKQQTFHLVLHFNDIHHPNSPANLATLSSNLSSKSESNSDGKAPMMGGKRASKYVRKVCIERERLCL